MKEKSRTEYSVINTTYSIISRVIVLVMGYVTRIVLVRTLSQDYVGINGLFTDILNVLSLTELGVGSAISYALYKPVSERDIEKQKSIMRLMKNFYYIVTAVILLAGLAVIPALPVLIKDAAAVEDLTLLYLMYLTNTLCSYQLIYKKTLLDADQLMYIGVAYQSAAWMVQYVLQILALVYTGSFRLYVLIHIAATLISNICISHKADKLYPYLRDKQVQPLDAEEKQGLFRNVRAIVLHKIGGAAVNNTDNLLLSAFSGLSDAGRYSNYYLIIASVNQLTSQLFQGITASVGNLGATADKKQVKSVFEISVFISFWVYGWAGICLYELLTPFIVFSFGEQYRFGNEIVLVLCINFILNGMRQPSVIFHDSLGLFWYDRYKSIAEAFVNLAVSVVLVYFYGTVGVFLGTMASIITTGMWIEPYVLYHHYFGVSCKEYFKKYIRYLVYIAIGWLLTDLACSPIDADGLALFAYRLPICLVVSNVSFLLLSLRLKEFKAAYEMVRKLVKKTAGKIKAKGIQKD